MKTLYEDYKQLRKERQELQTVKANVDALLKIEQVQDYQEGRKREKLGTGPIKPFYGFAALTAKKQMLGAVSRVRCGAWIYP